jgi:hypothetical protein
MAMQRQKGIKTGEPFEPKNVEDNMKKGGKVMKKEKMESMKEDIKQDKAIVKKAFKMHDAQEHKGGKGTNLDKLKKGGMAKKMVNKMAKGGVTSAQEKAMGRNMARAMNQKSSSRGR